MLLSIQHHNTAALHTARLLSLPLHTSSDCSPHLQPLPTPPCHLPVSPSPLFPDSDSCPSRQAPATPQFHGSPSHSSSMLLTLTLLPLTHSLHHPLPAPAPAPFQFLSSPLPTPLPSSVKPLPAPSTPVLPARCPPYDCPPPPVPCRLPA